MTHPISSITRGTRQSNFELLRIIAMFMVLGVHANFRALGFVTAESIAQAPVAEAIRCVCEALCIGSVNFFIFISGWFGIKSTLRGFVNFAFQVVFIYGLTYFVAVVIGAQPLDFKGLASIFCLAGNGWLIVCYTILYILAPALNALLDTASPKQLRLLLIAFFVFQTVWGWIGNVPAFGQGYSAISFMGIYLLSGYARRHRAAGAAAPWLWIFVGLTLFLALLVFVFPGRAEWLLYYDNPLIVFAAFSLTLYFSGLKIGHSSVINFVAKSAFAVYLLHSSRAVFEPVYVQTISESSGPMILLVIIGFYAMGLLIDQPRLWLQSLINKHFFNY